MRPLIREIRPEDARAFLEVHHAAVRGHASKDYSSEVIEAWAPMPITAQQVEGVRSNPDGEYRLGAEIGGRLVGIGVVQKNELRACYVTPSASRRGVGSALFREIERAAREQGTTYLEFVRKHYVGLHSFRSMRRIEARRRNASALRLRHSQSLASLRQRPSQARVRSTIQRLGKTTKALA